MPAKDLRGFAEFTGWEGAVPVPTASLETWHLHWKAPGSDEEWREEFKVLCGELGAEQLGLSWYRGTDSTRVKPVVVVHCVVKCI